MLATYHAFSDSQCASTASPTANRGLPAGVVVAVVVSPEVVFTRRRGGSCAGDNAPGDECEEDAQLSEETLERRGRDI